MTNFFKKTFLFFFFFALSIVQVHAITVDIPWDDIVVRDGNIPTDAVTWDSESLIKLIQQINQYLWFSIAVVCLVVVLYSGFNIIMAQWDKEKLKKANSSLTWAIIGIFIAIFSYVLVRLVVNLF